MKWKEEGELVIEDETPGELVLDETQIQQPTIDFAYLLVRERPSTFNAKAHITHDMLRR